MNDYQIIINTTPLGSLLKLIDFQTFPISILVKNIFYLILYNPKEINF